MGLLDRAGTIEYKNPSRSTDYEELARRIITGLPDQDEGPGFPGLVFDAFVKVLEFSKGALMLLDENLLEYSAWRSLGFDRTTVRRLHVPLNTVIQIEKKAGILTDEQKQTFEPMLSNREYGLSKQILLIRIGDDEAPAGILLVTDLSRPAEPSKSMLKAAILLADHFSQGLIKSRSWVAAGTVVNGENLRSWLEARGNQRSILAILDISQTIQHLVDSIPGLEPYQAQQDLFSLLRNFTGRMGRMREINKHLAAILFPWDRMIDQDLFLHQLNHALSAAFTHLNRETGMTAVFHEWPSERQSIEKSLSGFL